MRRALIAFALSLLAGAALPAADAGKFGQPLRGLPTTPLAKVLAEPEDGREVRLEGTVGAVCERKGCWLTLKEGERELHVTFAGYAFFMPRELVGKKVALEGKLEVREPRAEDVAHLRAEGAGDSVAARVSLVARGVEVLR